MTDAELAEYEEWSTKLNDAGTKLADSLALDHGTRSGYLSQIRTFSALLLKDLKEGRIDHMTARELAVGMRNEIMDAARQQSTPSGRFLAYLLKEKGKTLDQLVKEKAWDLWKKAPEALSQAEQRAVSEAIVESAGKDRWLATKATKFAFEAGKLVYLLTWLLTIHKLLTADNIAGEAVHIGFNWGGARIGGLIGAAACSETGPGAGICAFIGSIIGAFGGEAMFQAAREFMSNTFSGPRTFDDSWKLRNIMKLRSLRFH